MKSLTLVSAVLHTVTALNVVKLDFQKSRPPSSHLSERDAVEAVLDNGINTYTLNISIGTPPQPFSLHLDTGSSDLWVNTAENPYCQAGKCRGGIFDGNASSTFNDSIPNAFAIGYADHTYAYGDFVTDTVTIGDAVIEHQIFGIARRSNVSAGLIGVAFPEDESICGYQRNVTCRPYPTILDSMVNQGVINSHAYSLWLDGLNSSTGSILFGGIDTSKFQGDLSVLDIIPAISPYTKDVVYDNFRVAWTNITISGVDYSWTDEDAVPAILDSGTTLSYLPESAYNVIAQALNVTEQGFVACSSAHLDITFDFTFGADDGVTISVDISELVLDVLRGATFDDGTPACLFGVRSGTGGTKDGSYLLGDTFLRSAYVLYDLQNKKIGIAASDSSGGEENIVELNAAGDIPHASATYTYVPPAATSVTGSATAIGPVTATYISSGTGSPMPTYTGGAASQRMGSGYMIGAAAGLPLLMMM